MSINFMKPYWLWLLPFLIGFVWYGARNGRFASAFRRRLHSGIRIAVCVCIVMAMAVPQISQKSDIISTVFAIDRSASVKALDFTDFMKEANEARGNKDSVGMVCFGKDAGVEMMPTQEGVLPTESFLTYVDEGASDLASALKLAGAILPADAAKRIVLVSDGEETINEALLEARSLSAQGVTIDVYALEQKTDQEVQITDLELPSLINKNTAYDIAVRIDSNVDTPVGIRLYKGNTLIANEQISITAGESRIVFSDITANGGGVVYRAEITPEKDTQSKNNKSYAYTYIDDVPRVLLIGERQACEGWNGIISAAQLQVDMVTAGAAPVSTERLQSYDCVVMANVSAEALPDGFLEVLEAYVRILGGGLIVSGGDEAYALGGYLNTLLEDMLPVDMELKTEGEEPDLAMIMVIDRSGSMSAGQYGITQLEMAKEAAIRSLDGFKEKDQVGIIAFDDKFEWAVPMTLVSGNKAAIEEQIGKIQVGGGTSILPGLAEAVNTLSRTNAKEKHIILLTDGQAEQEGYGSVLAKIKENGITLSSVAVGGGADTTLLRKLAESGNGRYYFTDEFTDLPSIFAKETLLAGKEYLNNRNFYPQQKDASAILSDIVSVPLLGGYIGTTGKSRGDIILVSDKEEPILAAWQYGLGRTVAWTPDVGGAWTKDWLAAKEGSGLLRNALGWVINAQMAQDIKLTAQSGAQKSSLRLEMPFDEGINKIKASVLNSQGEEYNPQFIMTAPGIYEGELPTAEEGAYVANLSIEKDGKTEYYNTGFVLSYPSEYDMTRKGAGASVLQQIVAASGGRILESGSQVFETQPFPVVSQKDLSVFFMLLGLILFLLDIAFRRFSFLILRMEGIVFAGWNRAKAVPKTSLKLRQKPMQTGKMNPQKKELSPKAEVEKTPQESKPASTAEKLAAAKKKRGN
ncbi:von Willebrand factor type A domain protein [Anaerotignum neopropionicum]|uniref:von Willebrand factor type A domain protein n=1 Tax=Anaerotignum neopropionicum TaxID=36847 RepID=A0A136WBN3_9FIRM|nr:VWA domain-containing protein [Anaerotignum neopropionicum]KXL51908.1 von Willebrand factor type A domain protein [Anaerotignum neopropionicum]